jgi:maltooligosyltrehalose trehalohydrolase
MTALVLLGPGTPMLFQGQEFASSRKFQYFADVPENLADLVRAGRREFVAQWRSIRSAEMQACLSDPCSAETFESSKLDHSERERNRSIFELHADMLRLRREDPVLRNWAAVRYDGAVLSEHVFVLRAFSEEHGDRLLVFNLSTDLHLNPAPEPLLAPPPDLCWRVLFSTEHPKYGGCGTAPLDSDENWRIPGRSAVVLIPSRCDKEKGEEERGDRK